MIFSCVRAPEEGSSAASSSSIGFVKDRRRMNVAISRARSAMWIVGHLGTFARDRTWGRLINQAYADGNVVDYAAHSDGFGDRGSA